MRQHQTIDTGDKPLLTAAQIGTLVTVITIAVVAIIGVLVFDETVQTVDATNSTTIVNESFSGSFSGADDNFEYTVSFPADGDFESFGDDEEVYNSSSGTTVQLTEATDYEWFPANHTVIVENTSATRDGASGSSSENLNITYSFTRKPDGTYGMIDGFGDAMDLIPVVMLVLVASLVIAVVQRF